MGKPGRQTVEFNFYPTVILAADNLHSLRQVAFRVCDYTLILKGLTQQGRYTPIFNTLFRAIEK
jgi:hypothetical protein